MNRTFARLAFLGGTLAIFFGVARCGGDDSSSLGGATGSHGTTGSSDSGHDGTVASNDNNGGSANNGGGSDAPVDTGPPLYDRLGGHDGIANLVDAIVANEITDTDIASYFVPNEQPDASPTVADIKECLVTQLEAAGGGPVVYPTKLLDGYQCRAMKAAHAGLHIGNGTFDKFIVLATGALKAQSVATQDVNDVVAILVGTKSDIVDPLAPDGGPYDAGTE
jgi:truncated hemoglobin YjbI